MLLELEQAMPIFFDFQFRLIMSKKQLNYKLKMMVKVSGYVINSNTPSHTWMQHRRPSSYLMLNISL